MADTKDTSMQEILADIRGVISGDKPASTGTEVLELTEVVEKGKDVKDLPKQENKAEDIAKNIDQLFAEAKNKMQEENTQAATTDVTPQDKPVEAPVEIKTESETKEVATAEASVAAEPLKTEEIKMESTVEVNPVEVKEAKPDVVETKVSESITTVDEKQLSQDDAGKTLLSESAIEQTSNHFKNLLQAVARPHDNFGSRTGVTLEDLVIEALKPELKAWLDKNLPSIVKEIVEKEVRRLIPNDE